MSELSKLLSSALLLAAGFFGASLFGPPELAQRLVRHWSAPPTDPSQGLQPLAPGELLASRTLPTEPAPFTPPEMVRQTVAKQPVPSATMQTTWTTPDFSRAQPSSTPSDSAPPTPSGPSADFNAWLGSAGQWLRGEAAPAPATAAAVSDGVVTHAGGPVEWLPPRCATTPPPSTAPSSGPSLFATETPTAVDRATPPLGFDAWERPTVGALGPAPEAVWPAPSASADFRPVAREQANGFDTHVVTDGDTLPRIAERYLRDASRAAEIFELNRELLESPELLPIGVVLRLPREPRRPAPTAGAVRDFAPGPTPFSTVSVDPNLGFVTPSTRVAPRTTSEPRLVPVGGGGDDAPPSDPNARFERELSW